MEQKVIESQNINKYFHDPITIQVLREVTFSINKAEFVSVVGKSGCGKSTLLSMIAGLVPATSGDITVDGKKVVKPEVPAPVIPEASDEEEMEEELDEVVDHATLDAQDQVEVA